MTLKTKDLVIETIEKIATFGDMTKDQLYKLADDILREDMNDSQLCPMCEETQCDGDCPLRTIRPINHL